MLYWPLTQRALERWAVDLVLSIRLLMDNCFAEFFLVQINVWNYLRKKLSQNLLSLKFTSKVLCSKNFNLPKELLFSQICDLSFSCYVWNRKYWKKEFMFNQIWSICFHNFLFRRLWKQFIKYPDWLVHFNNYLKILLLTKLKCKFALRFQIKCDCYFS